MVVCRVAAAPSAGSVFGISALTREGCDMLTRAVYEHIAALRRPATDLPDPRFAGQPESSV